MQRSGEEDKAGYVFGLGLLLFIFLISTWTLIAAFDDVRSIASADPVSLLSLATAQHLGAAMSNLVTMTVAVSFLAAAVAIHNMAARYGFALGRAGLLPHRLAQIHPRHGTPHVAIGVQIFTTILVLAPFVILGADPIVNLFPIVSGVTALAMVGLLAACSLSVIVASFRGTVTGTVASTRILPTIALMGFLIVGGLIIFRYKE
ncbi:amino acid permease [Rhodococcus hoagii]|nr:amino acid permease [Prescottella equi]